MTLQIEISLALPERGYGGLGQIELRIAPAAYFSTGPAVVARHRDSKSFYQSISLRDGSTYLRWHGVGEFLISPDGGRITGRRHDRAHAESFQVYLLGQALSYALVKRTFEPLHATAIVVNGAAAVFPGNSGPSGGLARDGSTTSSLPELSNSPRTCRGQRVLRRHRIHPQDVNREFAA